MNRMRTDYEQWNKFFENTKIKGLVAALVVEACADRDRTGMKQAIEVQLYKYLKEEK